MQRAADISVLAHQAAMRASRAGVREYALQAEIERVFRQHDAVPAYGSIVGAGANACVLHYVANNAVASDGDLVLVDCRRRIPRLCLGHHAHLSGERPLLEGTARAA
jgi:Xaa-Pro aminopeptidase